MAATAVHGLDSVQLHAMMSGTGSLTSTTAGGGSSCSIARDQARTVRAVFVKIGNSVA